MLFKVLDYKNPKMIIIKIKVKNCKIKKLLSTGYKIVYYFKETKKINFFLIFIYYKI